MICSKINLNMIYFYIILAVLISIGIIIWIFKIIRQIKNDQEKLDWLNSRKFKLIVIKVPKNNEKTPLAAEQMFVALHGIYSNNAKFQEDISFEIVAKNQSIQFYSYIPEHLVDFVMGQIYAQYPTVEMEEVQDYTQYEMSNKGIAATELVLEKQEYYPIKTFPNFEVDPAASITAVLSNLKEGEQVWIQTIISPVDRKWQEEAQRYMTNLKAGVDTKIETTHKFIIQKLQHVIINVITQAISGPSDKEKKSGEEVKLSPLVEMGMSSIEAKITKLGFRSKIRVLAIARDEENARSKIGAITGAYKQFNATNINGFTIKKVVSDPSVLKVFQYRYFGEGGYIFNSEELASVYHFPNISVETPTIVWAGSKKGEPPADLPLISKVPAEELTVFAKTNYRNNLEKFGIKLKDRRLHMYVIGKTGTGKSTLLENMITDDINENRGVAIVDPHGETVNHIIDAIPEHRVKDVVYFNPADKDHTIGFNLLESVDPDLKPIVASGAVGVFKKIFGESWGPRLEYILRNSILALMDYPDATLLGVMKILIDKNFRTKVEDHIKDPVVKDFFINEYDKYDPKFRMEAISSIQNKVGQFLSTPMIRNIVGQPKSTFSIEDAMNQGKILLVDLSVGKIGEDNSALLGSMLITKIQLAAMRRANIPEERRRDFYLYVDEFQNFATDSFAVILSEARKYHLNLIMTNQYTAQLSETVTDAIFGNVGTMAVFRVGATDASLLEKEMEPVFTANDLVNLANYNVYLKMAIDGVTRPAFSAITLPPIEERYNLRDRIINSSRQYYTRSKSIVEQEIMDWTRIQSEPPEPGTAGTVKPKYERFKDVEGNIWYQGLGAESKTYEEHSNKSSEDQEKINSEINKITKKELPLSNEKISEIPKLPPPATITAGEIEEISTNNYQKRGEEGKIKLETEQLVEKYPAVTEENPIIDGKQTRRFIITPEESMDSLNNKIYHGLDDFEELEDGKTVQF